MQPEGPKDYFSTQSRFYAAFRPTYPDSLYRFLFQHLGERKTAWDCATGNGQVACQLAPHFERVFATDISDNQLAHARQEQNIKYARCAAEQTPFAKHQFDLVTVGQALHWFNLDQFYPEVIRVCRPGGLLAVWGYGLLQITPPIDEIILEYYSVTVGPYWDDARKIVEDEYRSAAFPFSEIRAPRFTIAQAWTLEQLRGYLLSWSATQHYIQTHGTNPVSPLLDKLSAYWHIAERKNVEFPLFLRVGRIGSS